MRWTLAEARRLDAVDTLAPMRRAFRIPKARDGRQYLYFCGNSLGNQLSLRIPTAPRALPKTLLRRGVICDFREPDVVRVAPVPLYTRFQDVHRLVQVLADVLH